MQTLLRPRRLSRNEPRARRGRSALVPTGAVLVLAGFAVIAAPPIAGASSPSTLYAAATATGSGTCLSVANACTLTTALKKTAPGDVVDLVTPGVEGTASSYYSGGFTVATTGTSASFPVVIEPAPGVTNPILDGGGNQPVLSITNTMHLVIENVTIQNGNSPAGGGIANNSGGTVSVSGSTFLGDDSAEGGAIDNGDNGGDGVLTVTGSTFSDDQADPSGGAIDNGDNGGIGVLTVTDSTFSGNNSNGNAGAIDNGDNSGHGTLVLTGSTFSGNTAVDVGPTIDNGDDGGTGTITVAADVFNGGCQQENGTWTDMGFNAGTDSSCLNGGTGDVANANVNKLGSLANNGGPTETMLLLPGNPAAGRIPNPRGVLCPVTADQTGQASPPGAPCNAGALQAHPVIKGVSFGGSPSAPTVAVTGSGFGTYADLGPPETPPGSPPNGKNWAGTLWFTDTTGNWTAGDGLPPNPNFLGLVVTSYTNTRVAFGFGSNIGDFGSLSNGDAYSLTLLGDTVSGRVLRVPAVTGLSPTSGPTTGGTTVTVTGSNFTGATTVLFGTRPASKVVVVSDTKITATSPSQAATGVVAVRVRNPAGNSPVVVADQFTYRQAKTSRSAS